MPKIYYDVDEAYNRIAYAREKEQLDRAYSEWVKSGADLDNTYNEKVKAYQGKSYIDGKDISDFSNNYGVQKNILADQGRNLRAQIQKYQKYIGQEQANKILSDIEKTANAQQQTFDGLKQVSDYYSQWDSEEAYNAAMKQQEAQQKEYQRLMALDVEATKQQYLQAQSSLDQVSKELSSILPDGATRYDSVPVGLADKIKALKAQKDELQNQVNAYYKDYNDANQLQRVEKYNQLTKAQDFEKLAKQGLAIKSPQYKDIQGKSFVDELFADYDSVSDIADNSAMLTDEEKNIYGYLVATQGENAANEYLNAILETINYRRGARQAENIQNSKFLQLASAVPAGIDQFAGGVAQNFQEDRIPTSATQFASGNIREDLNGTGWQIGYDLINTTANMAPSILLSSLITAATGGAGAPVAGAISAAVTGTSARGNAINEALAEGYTPDQASTYGTLVGASEGALQYLLGGISKLGGKLTGNIAQKAVGKIDNVLLRVAADTGIHMAGEGAEEYLQEILTPVFREIAFDEKNELKLFTEEALYSGILGALSAGLMEGPSTVSNAIADVQAKKQADGLQAQLDNRAAIAEAMRQGIIQDVSGKYNYSRVDSAGNVHIYSDVFQNVEPEKQRTFIKQYAQKNYITRFDEAGNIVGKDKGITIKSDNNRVYITGQGINDVAKKVRGGNNIPFMETILELPAIIENAQFVERVKDEKGRPFYWDNYQEEITVNGEPYRVTLKVKEPPTGGNRYYYHAIESIKIEPDPSHGSLDAENQRLPYLIRDGNGSSTPTIAQDTAGVNTNISKNGGNDTAGPIRIAQSELDQMKTVSEKLGVKLRIADTGEQYDGRYQDGVITISPRTSRPALVVYKHELTHYIAENTGYYEKLRDLVKEYYQQENANYPQMVRDRQDAHRLAGEEISYSEAEQEIVADFVGEHLFTDERAIQRLVEQEPNLGMRIKNWLRGILAYFKKDQQPALLMKAERLYQKAIDQVLKQRQEGVRAKQGEVKHSINPDFEAQYDRWDKKDNRGYFKVGTTSEALESIGINPSEIYWDKAKIIKIQKAHPDMTDEVIKQVPRLLENPMLIMQSQTAVNRIVVLGEVYADGKPVLCALELKPNGNIDNFIKIASAYPKNPLQNLVNTSDILYVNPDKNRTDSWLKAIRLQLPSGLTNYGSIHNVTYVDKNVKGNVTFGEAPAKTAMQAAFEKAGYNTNISEREENSTSEPKHSLNKRYAEMVEQYGKMKPGEHPTREVEVPKQTNDDTRVRQGVRTIMEAKGTPDTFVEELKADIADGIFNYEVISDKEAVSAAKSRLSKLGIQKCAAYWKEKMAGQKRMTKFDFALAEQMYIEAGENGDFKLAEELAVDMTMLGTEGGQLVQAQRLLKNLTPYGRLYKVEKIINQIQEELDTRFGKKSPTIEISEELKNQLHDAKSIQEMDDIEDAIVRDISKQLPAADFARKWNEWRYLAMLGNPKTHIRNIFGNLLFTPAVMGKNALGVAFEQAIPKEQRTKAFLSLKDKALFDFAKQDFAEMADFVLGERTDQRGIKAIEKYRRVYKNRVLEGMRKLNSKALEKEDKFFVEGHYISSMAQLIKARGWDVNNLTKQQLFAAREYATREARKATYRDESKVADALNRLSRTNKAAELIIGGNMPFKKTPVNILKRGVEYSPAGLVKGVKELCWDVRKGKMKSSEAIDSICSGLTGSMMMALGIWLSAIGVLKATPDDDKEETLERLSGGQEYAIEIGGKSYTIDWIAPMSMPLFVGAELQKAVENRGQEDAKITSRLIDAVCNISEPMFNLSMLQGLTSSIKAGAYSDQPIIDITANTLASYLTQGVPTLGGQIARSFDTKQRNSYYSSKDTGLEKLLDKTVKKAMAKVPGVSHLLEPYVDKWGKEESYGNLFLNALENFFSPGYASERTDDKVTEEVAQIYARSGESSVVPRTAPSSLKFDGETYRLQEKEYTAYQKTLGQKSHEMVNRYIQSDHYSDMTDAERALAIQKLYTYANEMAKKEFFTGRNIAYNDMPTVKKFTELEESGVELFDYLYASVKTKDIKGRKNAKGETISGSVKQNKIKCMVNELGFSRAEANKLYEFL